MADDTELTQLQRHFRLMPKRAEVLDPKGGDEDYIDAHPFEFEINPGTLHSERAELVTLIGRWQSEVNIRVKEDALLAERDRLDHLMGITDTLRRERTGQTGDIMRDGSTPPRAKWAGDTDSLLYDSERP